MDWLNRLLDDVALELAIEQQAVRLSWEVAMNGGSKEAIAMQQNLSRLRAMRSPEQIARMETEMMRKALGQK